MEASEDRTRAEKRAGPPGKPSHPFGTPHGAPSRPVLPSVDAAGGAGWPLTLQFKRKSKATVNSAVLAGKRILWRSRGGGRVVKSGVV